MNNMVRSCGKMMRMKMAYFSYFEFLIPIIEHEFKTFDLKLFIF